MSILRPRCPRLRRNLEFLAPGSLRPPIPQPGTVPLGSTRFRSHSTRLGGFRLQLRHRHKPVRFPPHATTACPAVSPQALHLPGPTPNRNPRPRSARSTGQRLNSQKSRYPVAHLPAGRRVPPRLGHRTVPPRYRSRFRVAFAGAKPGHGQHEHQKSLSPIRVGGGMPFGATPSIALPTETYPHARCVESEERSYSATEPRPLLNSPIRFPPRHPHPKPDPPACLRKNAPDKRRSTPDQLSRWTFALWRLLCGF